MCRFLLAKFQLDHICQVPPGLVMRALRKIPQDLEGALDDLMRRIQSSRDEVREFAFKTLAWVLHATRPLTVLELVDALSVEEWEPREIGFGIEEEDLLGGCAGLVFVEAGNGTVHFIHYGVQEYLLKHCSTLTIPNSLDIAKICLTYIGFEELEAGPVQDNDIVEFAQRLQEFPLLRYAALNWPRHLKGTGENDDEIRSHLEELSRSSANFETMLQIRHATSDGAKLLRIDNYPQSSTLLHLVSSEGLHYLVDWILEKSITISKMLRAKDGYGRIPLHEASVNGHAVIVRRFLALDPQLVHEKDGEGATSLHRAADAGQTEVVQILIANGADVFEKDNYGLYAVHRAVASSKVESAEIIFKRMSEIVKAGGGPTMYLEERREGPESTLLHYVAGLGYEQGVEWLLQAGAEAMATDRWGDTPLHKAAIGGHTTVVIHLLRCVTTSESVDVQTSQGHTALHFAAMYGRTRLIKTLLEEFHAYPSIRDFLGFTPLHWAAAGGHVEVVKQLLRVTEIRMLEDRAPNPFHLAVWANFPEVQKLICRHFSVSLTSAELAQYQDVYNVELFSFLESGAIATTPNASVPEFEHRCTLSMLLKYWASIEMLTKRREAATAWLDLDVVYSRVKTGDLEVNGELSVIRHIQKCDNCGITPMFGHRYRCTSCPLPPWFDLCSECFEKLSYVPHPHKSFVKVPSTIPLPSLKEQLLKLKNAYEGYEEPLSKPVSVLY